ncbi:hypothetical protein DOTSEDRAFT_75767 [Dothistroma septosporum NZE10]|uniref:DUF1746 domain-containing protein n=1 Tax=Dothistroma septosporum (strain NZE10 / CBS 128990) TaxID=675120 RepID=N1PBP3_DOTSN|nr:hypothetical protein DOTSEDRAFT_75767 [Dothistroma septosporum NZE10]
MNDELSSSERAGPSGSHHDDTAQHEVLTPAQIVARRKKNRENFNKRRGELLDDLSRNIDLLVYAELSAIYYMDCSFLKFGLRSIIQLIFLTPKPALFPEPPSNRPYIGAILGSGLLCVLLHAIGSAPSAGEATRGYLHGGLVMDFIGQKGPSSKIHLLLLDVLSLVLQITQLSMHTQRQKLKESPATVVSVTTSAGTQYNAPAVGSGQSLDNEERGVRASAEREREDDIEMQNLNPAGSTAEIASEAAGLPEREALLERTTLPPRTDAHIFDAFNSGQIVLGDFNLIRTIKDQSWAYQKSPADANSAERNRLMRERLAARISRWRFEPSPVAGATVG